MPSLIDALQSALAVASEYDPRGMTPEELAILDRLDDQIGELLDALIDIGECRPQMQACIRKAMGRT